MTPDMIVGRAQIWWPPGLTNMAMVPVWSRTFTGLMKYDRFYFYFEVSGVTEDWDVGIAFLTPCCDAMVQPDNEWDVCGECRASYFPLGTHLWAEVTSDEDVEAALFHDVVQVWLDQSQYDVLEATILISDMATTLKTLLADLRSGKELLPLSTRGSHSYISATVSSFCREVRQDSIDQT